MSEEKLQKYVFTLSDSVVQMADRIEALVTNHKGYTMNDYVAGNELMHLLDELRGLALHAKADIDDKIYLRD